MSKGLTKSFGTERPDSLLLHSRIQWSFSRKHVDYSDAVKNFYLEDGLAYISCSISKFSDVIDSYSVRQYAWPNRDFIRFIEDNAANIPSGYPIVLELCGTCLSKKQKEIINRALTNYYELKLGDSQKNVQNNRMKAFTLFALTLVSAMTLLAYWMFSSGNGLLQEVLLIGFWFFLWEWGDVIAFERGNVNGKQKAAAQLASLSIIFNEHFVDEPLDEEIRNEIIENILTNQAKMPVIPESTKDAAQDEKGKVIVLHGSRNPILTA